MQKLNKRSGSSLFLMEMILSILILALACTACIRIFAAAGTDRRKARELNHIQTLTASAGEILEGWTGDPDDFLSLFPGGIAESGKIYYYYDKEWTICPEEEARYSLSVQLSTFRGIYTECLNIRCLLADICDHTNLRDQCV